MTLNEWLEQQGKTQAGFAREIKAPRQYVYRWCKGDNYPGEKFMQEISEKTGGLVTPNDWYGLP
ncbi:MAG: helix-turn-helix domain-containing protein [Pseudomonadales bacterium]